MYGSYDRDDDDGNGSDNNTTNYSSNHHCGTATTTSERGLVGANEKNYETGSDITCGPIKLRMKKGQVANDDSSIAMGW